MKKIPSLDDLQAAAAPKLGEATEPGATPVTTEGATPVIRADDLPADVLEHAVRLGSEDVPAPSSPPKRGTQRKAGGRLQVRRRYARERAVQALYAWDVGDASATEVLRYFLEQQDMSRADVDFFEAGFKGVAHAPGPIDALIEPVIDRGFEELDPVERAILRLGIWELRSRPDSPVRVVINEMVGVAKRFGAEQGHRFVNGVLDTVARDLRAAEL